MNSQWIRGEVKQIRTVYRDRGPVILLSIFAWILLLIFGVDISAATTGVRLEFVSGDFFGSVAAGTLFLKESSTGSPISQKEVSVKIFVQNRGDSGWQHYTTDASGAVRFTIGRLIDPQTHSYYDTCSISAEFNIRRTSSDPNRQLYTEYGTSSYGGSLPTPAASPPVAIIYATEDGNVLSDCLETNKPIQFVSLSLAANGSEPNQGIDDLYWSFTDPAGNTSTHRGTSFTETAHVSPGVYTAQLVIWDHAGRVAATSRQFHPDLHTFSLGGPSKWGTCPVLNGGTPSAHTLATGSNGSVEIECTDGCRGHAFRLRWRPTTGPASTIGQCFYDCGENHGWYVKDFCADKIVKVVWRNEEGHAGSLHEGMICDYNGNGYADVDIYTFTPDTSLLAVLHLKRNIHFGYWVGPSRPQLPLVYSGSAPLSDNELCHIRDAYDVGGSTDVPKISSGDGATVAEAIVVGSQTTGNLTLALEGISLDVPMVAGLSGAEVAQRIVDAINGAPGMAEAEISAQKILDASTGFWRLAITGAVEENITTSGAAAAVLTAFSNFPSLTASMHPGQVQLCWPESPVGFALEMSSSGLSGGNWTPVTTGSGWTTNAGVICASFPVAPDPASFFRLVLRP